MTTADRTAALLKGAAIGLGLVDPAEDDEVAVFALLVNAAEVYTRMTNAGCCDRIAYTGTLQSVEENLEMLADDEALTREAIAAAARRQAAAAADLAACPSVR